MKLRMLFAVLASSLLLAGAGAESSIGAPRLFVTNNLTRGNSGGRLLEFNGSTGAFNGLIANIDTPRGIKVGPDGNLYVASTNGQTVLKFDVANGLQQTTFVTAESGGLLFPYGLTFGPDNNLYVASTSPADPFSPRATVLRFDGATGNFLDVFATLTGPVTLGFDVTFGPDGNLYLSTSSSGVYKFDGQSGALLGTFIPTIASSIIFGPDQNLYISTGLDDSVWRYNGGTGVFMDVFVASGSGGLRGPRGLAFGPDGYLYVAGGASDAVHRYDGQTGAFAGKLAGNPMDGPQFFVFLVPEPDCFLLVVGAALLCKRRLAGHGAISSRQRPIERRQCDISR